MHFFQESYVDEGLAQLEGESLGDMLDFLSKELIRLQVSGHFTFESPPYFRPPSDDNHPRIC